MSVRELAAYINTMREAQRARIARELHDVVGGMLTSMKMDIQRINRRTDDPELKAIVGDLLHFSGFFGVSGSLVCLRGGIGIGPHVGGTVGTVHTLARTTGFGE